MKLNQLILFVFFLSNYGCLLFEDPEEEITTSDLDFSSPPAPQPPNLVPMKWPLSSLPLNVKISDSFSEDDRTFIESMGEEWEITLNHEIDFFDFDPNLTPNQQHSSLINYHDDEIGIYSIDSWFEEVGPYVLAITQFFGFRRNAGSSNEYIEMNHADIMINYDIFAFSNDLETDTYDLPSIVLHELGHMIGLDHIFSNESSVMAPSIAPEFSQREPYPIDQSILYNLYDLTQMASIIPNARFFSAASLPTPQKDIPVSGYIELRADGSCHHYIDDKMVY